MSTDSKERADKTMSRVRAVWHFAMGGLLLFLGAMILIHRQFGTVSLQPAAFAYVLGGLVAFYGAFRFWRGILEVQGKGNFGS